MANVEERNTQLGNIQNVLDNFFNNGHNVEELIPYLRFYSENLIFAFLEKAPNPEEYEQRRISIKSFGKWLYMIASDMQLCRSQMRDCISEMTRILYNFNEESNELWDVLAELCNDAQIKFEHAMESFWFEYEIFRNIHESMEVFLK